nr:hypothetical protein [Pseudomonas sp. P7548]
MKVEQRELDLFVEKLLCVIDFDKDLPENVFLRDEYIYWFFERPLLCFYDLFSGLVLESVSSFKSDVFIKFSGGQPLSGSCFSIDSSNISGDSNWLVVNSENFFEGTVGYPIVLCNDTDDWFAFESAHEEFGVLAVNKSSLHEGFLGYLNANLISMSDLSELAKTSVAEGVIAQVLISYYG